EIVPRSYVRRHRDALAGFEADAQDALSRARARLAGADAGDEAAFAQLETAGNRLLKLEAARAENRALRVASGTLVPSRDAEWKDLVLPDAGDEELAWRLARTRIAEGVFAARLEQRYRYDLLGRNCASEIFRTVDAADVAPGGRVETDWPLTF